MLLTLSTYVNDYIQFDVLIAVQVFAANEKNEQTERFVDFDSVFFCLFSRFGYLLRVSKGRNKTAASRKPNRKTQKKKHFV